MHPRLDWNKLFSHRWAWICGSLHYCPRCWDQICWAGAHLTFYETPTSNFGVLFLFHLHLSVFPIVLTTMGQTKSFFFTYLLIVWASPPSRQPLPYRALWVFPVWNDRYRTDTCWVKCLLPSLLCPSPVPRAVILCWTKHFMLWTLCCFSG